MDKEIVFYKFNAGSSTQEQKSQVINCKDLGEAHKLYDVERKKMEMALSIYNYIDITVRGSLLRSWQLNAN